MGASAAIIVGLISYNNGYDLKTICVRMTAGMIIFFAAGVFLRKLINNVYEEVSKNEQKVSDTSELSDMDKKEHDKNHGIDYRVGDDSSDDGNGQVEGDKIYDEEFTPLEASRVTIKDNKF